VIARLERPNNVAGIWFLQCANFLHIIPNFYRLSHLLIDTKRKKFVVYSFGLGYIDELIKI